MFSGLSAFPLTPIGASGLDEEAFCRLIHRLKAARVNSIGALGSTGSCVYLNREERLRVTQLAVEHAEGVPVLVGISALRTNDVLHYADDAQQAGATGVLLAPVSYQSLTEEEVFSFYETVTRTLSVPLCVYDNPGTTHFSFSDALHGEISRFPHVQSIKLPGVPMDPISAKGRIDRLRSHVSEGVTLGISGDAFALAGLNAGCEVWYSVLGGLYPEICMRLTHFALMGLTAEAESLSNRLEPLWGLFLKYGSLRVVSALAEMKGLADHPNLPLPVQGLPEAARQELDKILDEIELD